jgi:hypothetical protein
MDLENFENDTFLDTNLDQVVLKKIKFNIYIYIYIYFFLLFIYLFIIYF